jgi:hypothetical protein
MILKTAVRRMCNCQNHNPKVGSIDNFRLRYSPMHIEDMLVFQCRYFVNSLKLKKKKNKIS